jgi:hypothetical protein
MMRAELAERIGSIFAGISLVYCDISGNTLGACQGFLEYSLKNIASVELLLK